jgi:DNA-binding transcriptional ArsR family regulator
VVTEQHLYLALETFNHAEAESDLSELALDSIAMYAVQEIAKTKDEFTEEEFAEFINQLIVQHTLSEMTKKGLVEAELDGEDVVYGITELGKGLIDNLNKGDVSD